MYIDQKIKKLLTSIQWQIHFFVFRDESTFKKTMILSILLVSERVKLQNIEANFLDTVIGIIQW